MKDWPICNVSHELKTPVTSIIGATEIIKTLECNNEAEELIKVLDSSSRHLLDLINNVLDITKVESETVGLHLEKIEINNFIMSIKNLFSERMKEKFVKFQINQGQDLPETIISDEVKLRQIVVNFISNALKFTENNGEITFNISKKDGGEKLLFSVKDNGVGIDQEKLEDIFLPFIQEDSSITKKYGGTGLGLHLSKELSDLLGGKLTVESKAREGSTFTLTLPISKQ